MILLWDFLGQGANGEQNQENQQNGGEQGHGHGSSNMLAEHVINATNLCPAKM